MDNLFCHNRVKKALDIVQWPKFKTAAKQHYWIARNLHGVFPEADFFEWRTLKNTVELTVFVRDGLHSKPRRFCRIKTIKEA